MELPPADLLATGGVRLEVDGPVVTVVLDRPERRNAHTPATWHALATVGEAVLAAAPHELRAVVLRAEGPTFSAGLDRRVLAGGEVDGVSFASLAARGPEGLDAAIAEFQRAFTWWRSERVVTVAAVQGHAVGAGFQLALGCDLRVVAHDARFAMREPSLGLVPDLGGTWPLVAAVGYPRALELCGTGRELGAEEAVAWGLAAMSVPGDQLAGATADLVAALLATPAGALVETKALLHGAGERGYEEQRAAERAAQARRLAELLGGSPSA